MIIPVGHMAELRALRDVLATKFSEQQVLQAEVALAKAKLDQRKRQICMEHGVSPNVEIDEETGEILAPAPK